MSQTHTGPIGTCSRIPKTRLVIISRQGKKEQLQKTALRESKGEEKGSDRGNEERSGQHQAFFLQSKRGGKLVVISGGVWSNSAETGPMPASSPGPRSRAEQSLLTRDQVL